MSARRSPERGPRGPGGRRVTQGPSLLPGWGRSFLFRLSLQKLYHVVSLVVLGTAVGFSCLCRVGGEAAQLSPKGLYL